MAKTVPWAVETDETVFRALELRANREGGTVSDVVEALLRRALAAEIDEVSGAVPLAAMIQTVIRHGTRSACQATSRPPAAPAPTTPRPAAPASRPPPARPGQEGATGRQALAQPGARPARSRRRYVGR